MAKVKKVENEVLDIQAISLNEFRVNLLGTSPMIMNRYSQKAWQQLLFPTPRSNRAGLEQTLKHEPYNEFRGAVYMTRDTKAKSLIHLPNGAIHGALASAAIDIPGAKKAQIERLTTITDINIELFGVPHIFCAMVRNSDQNRTPDVRTRPIFPEWACTITVRYVRSILTERSIGHLLGAAGVIVGVGDWRPQKGGPYGRFNVVGDNDSDFNRIVKKQGRTAQRAALDHVIYYDDDTRELLQWFDEELNRRKEVVSAKPKRGNGAAKRARKMPTGKVIVENVGGDYLGVE